MVDTIIENDYCYQIMESTTARLAADCGIPDRVSSTALLRDRKELVIVHNGREYRLRLTQNGKLILTA